MSVSYFEWLGLDGAFFWESVMGGWGWVGVGALFHNVHLFYYVFDFMDRPFDCPTLIHPVFSIRTTDKNKVNSKVK